MKHLAFCKLKDCNYSTTFEKYPQNDLLKSIKSLPIAENLKEHKTNII